MFTEAANRRYTIWTVVCWSVYAALISGAGTRAFDTLSQTGKAVFGIAIAAPIAAHVWATLVMIRQADEFARAMAAKSFILAWGICITLFSTWGFLESYADAPHAPGWLVYPLFWLVFFALAPFVRTTR
jgi:putative oxidoreductase